MAATGLSSGGDKKKRGNKYLCGTPQDKCCGANSQVASALKNSKTHSTPQESFACYAAYLIGDGYTQVGPREFSKNNGPILVLNKKSRFGCTLRGGKGSRFMPKQYLSGGVY